MAKPFDVTLKELVHQYPRDWLAQVGFTGPATVEVIDAEVSTVTAMADKVLRIAEPEPWLAHFELQASYDLDLPRRVLKYNVLLNDRHGLPVESVVVLLRPAADGPNLTGIVEYRPPQGRSRLRFEYDVVRVWQQPVDRLLAGGLGTLPLAPLSAVAETALPGVIERMDERVEREATIDQSATLWTSTYILMGLRYPREFASQLLKGVRAMKESVTYQAILEEGEAKGQAKGEAKGEIKGRLQEARKLLLRVGQKRFGLPAEATCAAIEAIADLERLERLHESLQQVAGWDELLAAP